LDVAKELLKTLKNENKVTPIFLIKRFHVSKSEIHNSLRALKSVGLIQNVERGLYEITPAGLTLMNTTEFIEGV